VRRNDAGPVPTSMSIRKSRPDWTGKTVVDTTNAHYAPGSAEVLRGRLRRRSRID
jgi:8-hydroxy-5-deazaflavin:NADPH oxidoreductase